MREGLDHWPYVIAAYAVAVVATLAMVGWSWLAMRRAERKREETRRK
jgi:heme exporter protein CcmD